MASWELTDAGLGLTDAVLDGESFPELDVWMSQKPWRSSSSSASRVGSRTAPQRTDRKGGT
jgi:hypothetical protein